MNPTTLTVHQLNRQIRLFLEQDIGEICVVGELSNFSKPASGHYYFTLKDDQAQLKCAFFRNYHAQNSNSPKPIFTDGQQVIARGLVSLYEARGDYQLIVHELTAYGLGELSRQYELLKIKLTQQGLFADSRKRQLPRFPQQIAVITSQSGAALHDILTTLGRRYPVAGVLLYPCEVQGKNAASQVIAQLLKANRDQQADVIILARGGGSLEDLWAFNDEQLALTIYNSTIPVVTGIGHETDFTIADFVADYRAATPTAAAEAVTPSQLALQQLIEAYLNRLKISLQRRLLQQQTALTHLRNQLTYPRYIIQRHAQTIDYLQRQLLQIMQQQLQHQQHRLHAARLSIEAKNPTRLVHEASSELRSKNTRLINAISIGIQAYKKRLSTTVATLHAVSPLATLARGYALATFNNQVIQDSAQVNCGDLIHIQLAHGDLSCEVIEKQTEQSVLF